MVKGRNIQPSFTEGALDGQSSMKYFYFSMHDKDNPEGTFCDVHILNLTFLLLGNSFYTSTTSKALMVLTCTFIPSIATQARNRIHRGPLAT
jgi:hypothetical protein